jgi:hypothetical protein
VEPVDASFPLDALPNPTTIPEAALFEVIEIGPTYRVPTDILNRFVNRLRTLHSRQRLVVNPAAIEALGFTVPNLAEAIRAAGLAIRVYRHRKDGHVEIGLSRSGGEQS